MGEVIPVGPKREREREALIRGARAIYESIFPSEKRPTSEQRGPEE
jgi:hypothetical protein